MPLRAHGVAALLAALALATVPARAQAPQTVGRIEGEDIAVKGAISVEVESGWSATMLASGSEVTVRSGRARLALVEGGEISVCGPAHFSVLKSGGALTLALDYGRVHTRLQHPLPISIYTPMIVATPIGVADWPRDATVGLDAAGAMCVLAERGAVRIEQQFTGQSLLVPQSGEVQLAGGQLESLRGSSGGCQCEVLVAKSEARPAPKLPELSVPAPARPVELSRPAEKSGKPETRENLKPPATEEPIYQVLMPPIMFNANAPAPPPGPSPEMILLIREARVQPALVFHGRVEAASLPSAQPETEPTAPEVAAPPKKPGGLFSALGGFFRRLFGGGKRQTCSGAGCR